MQELRRATGRSKNTVKRLNDELDHLTHCWNAEESNRWRLDWMATKLIPIKGTKYLESPAEYTLAKRSKFRDMSDTRDWKTKYPS